MVVLNGVQSDRILSILSTDHRLVLVQTLTGWRKPMTDGLPDPSDAPDSHPDSTRVRDFRDHNDDLEYVRRISEGKLNLPWPYSSIGYAIASGACFVSAGGLLVTELMKPAEETIGGLILVTLVLIVSGLALAHVSRWFHKHFETGEEPRYVDDG